ncbi:hypothetical protein J437_LFUL018288 [Ladona fulva]|uniref:Uncharacterized protein n=1 Tax=Ladona fulva TaxID=123851 RepID=A0A8K0KRB6_LADFU|nr:hypothetical protein J437_LFUL018288 [Ladona fulva]
MRNSSPTMRISGGMLEMWATTTNTFTLAKLIKGQNARATATATTGALLDTAEEIRGKIGAVLEKARLPRPNLTREEIQAITRLHRKKEVVVLPADKGNATVLLPTKLYEEKMEKLLDDRTYRIISRDPTDSLVKKTTALLKKSGIPDETIRSLRPQSPVSPRLYGLPKIHKEGVPLRPIVSAINSPTHLLAKYLARLLTPHVGESNHHVKNSAEFNDGLRSNFGSWLVRRIGVGDTVTPSSGVQPSFVSPLLLSPRHRRKKGGAHNWMEIQGHQREKDVKVERMRKGVFKGN